MMPVRVKWRQVTWPRNSEIRPDKMATNNIKMGHRQGHWQCLLLKKQ